MRRLLFPSFLLALSVPHGVAQRPGPGSVRTKYLYGKNSAVKVLQHVRIIDGTGAAVLLDQTANGNPPDNRRRNDETFEHE